MAAAARSNAYLRTKVLTAKPAELRLMLLDGAIRFAEQGREGLARKDYEASYNGFTRSQDIVMELLAGLRPEHDPELCAKLSALYTYIYRRLVAATTERALDVADEAIELLRFERDTWGMLMHQLGVNSPQTEQGAGISVKG
jgi:flagellar secretion chaperone FliS